MGLSTDASGHRLRLIQTGQPDLPVVPGGPPSHITHLHGSGRNVALTVDDGASAEVVSAYIDFARATGIRLSSSSPALTLHGPSTRTSCVPWWTAGRSSSGTTRGPILT